MVKIRDLKEIDFQDLKKKYNIKFSFLDFISLHARIDSVKYIILSNIKGLLDTNDMVRDTIITTIHYEMKTKSLDELLFVYDNEIIQELSSKGWFDISLCFLEKSFEEDFLEACRYLKNRSFM